MKAFIYTGGRIYPENIIERPAKGDLCIAADSGYLNALALGVRPDILIGDFDSLKTGAQELPRDIKIITLPCEKDVTDTQYAVDLAVREGADEIVIVGGLDGRLDHTLSTLAILETLCELGVSATVVSGANRARFLRSTSILIPRSPYKYLSLIAADEKVRRVSVSGCKYPLTNATLHRKFQFAVSNEIVENVALVSVGRGGIYIIESRDI